MQDPFVTAAVVLAAVPYGEADRIVTLYTRDHGKVSAMARAARKSRARFGAALALFVDGEATLRERRGAELLVLEAFDVRADHSSLANDVVKMAHGAYATELLRELTVPRHADPVLHDLILELYRVTAGGPPRSGTLRAFELRLLDEIGLRPVLDRCLGCDAEDAATLDAAGAIVDAGRGGLLCGDCAGRVAVGAVRAFPSAARARLLACRACATLAEAADLAAEPSDADARAVMHALVHAHLRAPMRSLEFIRQLRAQ